MGILNGSIWHTAERFGQPVDSSFLALGSLLSCQHKHWWSCCEPHQRHDTVQNCLQTVKCSLNLGTFIIQFSRQLHWSLGWQQGKEASVKEERRIKVQEKGRQQITFSSGAERAQSTQLHCSAQELGPGKLQRTFPSSVLCDPVKKMHVAKFSLHSKKGDHQLCCSKLQTPQLWALMFPGTSTLPCAGTLYPE